MKRVLKPMAAMLAALIFLTGCQSDTSWIYKNGDTVLPAGVYINYMMVSFNEAFNKLYVLENEQYYALIAENPEAEIPKSIYEMDRPELLTQELEGISVADWVSWNAQKLSRRYMAVEAKVRELGLSLTAEEIENSKITARNTFENVVNYDENNNPVYGRVYFPDNGISENSIMLVSQISMMQERLFKALYGEGGEFEIPRQEMVDYFTSNYIRGQQLVMRKPSINDFPQVASTEEDGELTPEQQAIADALDAQSQAQLAQATADLKSQAENYEQRMKSGASIEDLTWDYDKSRSDAPDSVLKNPDGSLDFIVLNDDYSGYGQEVVDGLASLAPGESKLLELNDYFILIKRLDILEKPEDFEEHLEGVMIDLRFNDDYLPKLDEWGESLSLSVNNASISRYTANKLK